MNFSTLGDNGIPFVTLRAGQMAGIQCQSKLEHQTTNEGDPGKIPEERFSWSSNSVSFVATKVILTIITTIMYYQK